MIVQQSVGILQQSFQNLLWAVAGFLPLFLLGVVIFIIGWIIAVWLGWFVAEVVRAIKLDHALRSAGFSDVVSRAGYTLNSGAFLGALVKWFIIAVFFVAALQVMGLGTVTYFLQQVVVGFLPNVIIAVLIILVAAVIAEVAKGAVVGSARAAGIVGAGFAGSIARWAIWIFAIIAALSQLGIASAVLQTLLTGVVVALSLAFGLAFGLGGQESAARFLEHMRSEMTHRH